MHSNLLVQIALTLLTYAILTVAKAIYRVCANTR